MGKDIHMDPDMLLDMRPDMHRDTVQGTVLDMARNHLLEDMAHNHLSEDMAHNHRPVDMVGVEYSGLNNFRSLQFGDHDYSIRRSVLPRQH